MKVFLFLYPIVPYFESSLAYPDEDALLAERFAYFNQVIDARYRQPGHAICWLCFSKPDDAGSCDGSLLHGLVDIRPEDTVIPAGIGFKEYCRTKRDPDLAGIFEQLPTGMKELWISGFHLGGCVDKMGRHAYYRAGLKGKVTIDEDLTEMFFAKLYSLSLRPSMRQPIDGIPLIREHTYAGLGFSAIDDWKTGPRWARVRRKRNLVPWHVHK